MPKELKEMKYFLDYLHKVIKEESPMEETGEKAKKEIFQADEDCWVINGKYFVTVREPIVAAIGLPFFANLHDGIFCELGAPLVSCLEDTTPEGKLNKFNTVKAEFQKTVAAYTAA